MVADRRRSRFELLVPRTLQLLVLFSLGAASQAAAQTRPEQQPEQPRTTFATSERLFFPKDWLRGYADFAIAPPHNEPDLGRCNQMGPTCTAFARYVMSGYVEFQPFGRTPLKHVFVFFEPRAWFGKNVPQISYTYSMQPLAFERVLGVGIELPKNFELRLTGHSVTSFGKFSRSLGLTDSGPNSPLGLNNTISVRWYFGGYGRRTQEPW